jgi:hypothetical protein
MPYLKEKHSGAYFNEVLLNTLRFYNIEYNITRLVNNLINKIES